MVSTFAASAHFLTCPVMSSGLGSHQTPVAVWDLVIDSKSGPALIGPTLMKKEENLEFCTIGIRGESGLTCLELVRCVGILKRGGLACTTKKPSDERVGILREPPTLVASRAASQSSKANTRP